MVSLPQTDQIIILLLGIALLVIGLAIIIGAILKSMKNKKDK